MAAPICSERQRLLAGRSERSGRWPSRVCITWYPSERHAASTFLIGSAAEGRVNPGLDDVGGAALTDRGTREGEVVTHLVHVAALTAEVDLHVDHEEHLTHAPSDR